MKAIRFVAFGLALALSAGPASAQGRGGFGFGGPGGRGGGMSGLVQMEEVQKELKLDAAQVDLLKQLGMEMREKMRAVFQGAGQGGNREEMQAKMRAMSTENDKKVAEILDKNQISRLKQLSYQRQGPRALAEKEVQTSLKLSAAQVSQVDGILKAENDERQKMFQGADFRNMTDEARRAMFQKMQDMTKVNSDKLTAILTEPQKAQWKTMLGAPFTFPEGGQGRRRNNNNN